MQSTSVVLPGAVRTDEEAQLALVHDEVHPVERLEPVEAHRQVAQLEHRHGHVAIPVTGAWAGSLSAAPATADIVRRVRPAEPLERRAHQAGERVEQPDDAAGEERHHHDEQQTLEVEPVVGAALAEARLAPAHEQRADDRAVDRRASADRDPRDHEDRRQHRELVRCDDADDRRARARRRGRPCPPTPRTRTSW